MTCARAEAHGLSDNRSQTIQKDASAKFVDAHQHAKDMLLRERIAEFEKKMQMQFYVIEYCSSVTFVVDVGHLLSNAFIKHQGSGSVYMLPSCIAA